LPWFLNARAGRSSEGHGASVVCFRSASPIVSIDFCYSASGFADRVLFASLTEPLAASRPFGNAKDE
jgi:hypothetical protein